MGDDDALLVLVTDDAATSDAVLRSQLEVQELVFRFPGESNQSSRASATAQAVRGWAPTPYSRFKNKSCFRLRSAFEAFQTLEA